MSMGVSSSRVNVDRERSVTPVGVPESDLPIRRSTRLTVKKKY
jgi:hypothetical protein